MNISRPKDSILGVTIAGRTLHAVLVQDGPDGPEVIRRFSRQLTATPIGGAVDLPGSVPIAEDETDSSVEDFTIQFGGGGSGSDLFLSSEFAGLEGSGGDASGGGGAGTPVQTFDLEIREIMAECAEAGLADPYVAFCVTTSHVNCVELQIAREATKKSEDSGEEKIDRSVLIELLSAQLDTEVDEERAAFLPMTKSDSGMNRRLAIMSKPSDPVGATLKAMRERKTRMPAVRLLDSEVSLFLGLARAAYFLTSSEAPAADDNAAGDDLQFAPRMDLGMGPRKTLVVRAGSEDTLVMFLEDDQLLHYESLRSITTYDAPETICSRVLLLQDEYGVGDVQHVLLLSDDREEAIIESFKMFFSDTRVESLRTYLPKFEEEGVESVSSSNAALAVAVALRLVDDELYKGAFQDVNLLPKRLLRRRIKLPVTWHVLALYGALFVTVVFFVGRYFTTESDIKAKKYKVEQYSQDVAYADPAVLQARVDSIRAITVGYQRALHVLDSLLIGSDRWSRSLEMTNREASVVKGLWIDRWRPVEGNMVEIKGNATSRDRIVSLAERVDGQITSLTFSEIREWPVYTFEMKLPLRVELPEAARYLREQVARENEAAQAKLNPPSTAVSSAN